MSSGASKGRVVGEQAPSTYQFADLFEAIAATVPDRIALVCGQQRISYAGLDDRASRVATLLAVREVAAGDFVGVMMRNSIEHVEVLLALYKLRAVPVNMNTRYVATEVDALIADAQLIGVIHDADLALHLVVADDLAESAVVWSLPIDGHFDDVVAAFSPTRPIERSSDDLYAIYTGGTTGRPKGVLWRMEDAFFACLGGGDPTGSLGWVERPREVLDRIVEDKVFLAIAPLIHGAGLWPTMRWLIAGATVVLERRFDPAECWRLVERERVTVMNVVADAMAGPLVEALERTPSDISSLQVLATSGAPMSPTMKSRLAKLMPGVVLRDIYGSSETGSQGWSTYGDGDGTPTAFLTIDTIIVDPETWETVTPGSSSVGVVARCDRVPLRYHNDAEASRATFVTRDGRRYALTGDVARVGADGALVLLGRGSLCINTGGEKVHPEEVEAVLRSNPAVRDTVVLGERDARWGESVAALIELADGFRLDEEDLQLHCREKLAAYKVPRRFVPVPAVQRTVVGKVDYAWATAAIEAAGADA